MIPTELFHSMVDSHSRAYSQYFTQLMGVGPNADNYENYIVNTHVLLSLPGAEKQSFHLDTNKHDHVIMLHAITRRYIWIRDFRGDFFKVLQSGDVLIFHGDCCHADAKNDSKRNSIALYVPIGFRPTNTFNCLIRESNI